MALEDDSMEPNSPEYRHVFVRVPPSYEECASTAVCPRADYVASPLAVAALFGWDEEDD
jgi:hypothetical protein